MTALFQVEPMTQRPAANYPMTKVKSETNRKVHDLNARSSVIYNDFSTRLAKPKGLAFLMMNWICVARRWYVDRRENLESGIYTISKTLFGKEEIKEQPYSH